MNGGILRPRLAVADTDHCKQRVFIAGHFRPIGDVRRDRPPDVFGLAQPGRARQLAYSAFALRVEIDLFALEGHIHHLMLRYTPPLTATSIR